MNDFIPSRVVVLSELSIKKKEIYYQLLLANGAKFKPDSEGRFVANVRIVSGDANKAESNMLLKRKDQRELPMSITEERLARLEKFGLVRVNVVEPHAETYYVNHSLRIGSSDSTESVEKGFDYVNYARFAALISSPGDVVTPKIHPYSWTMKIIDDIYDSRFVYEKHSLQKEEEFTHSNANNINQLMKTIFPIFVVKRLHTTMGLTHIVDQTGWDLLYNVHLLR